MRCGYLKFMVFITWLFFRDLAAMLRGLFFKEIFGTLVFILYLYNVKQKQLHYEHYNFKNVKRMRN